MCWLFPREYCDLSGLGQPLDDLGFVVCVVNAGLPELSGVAVLLPVVVPVSSTVCAETEDVDLEGEREGRLGRQTARCDRDVACGLTSSQTCRAKKSTSMPVEG